MCVIKIGKEEETEEEEDEEEKEEEEEEEEKDEEEEEEEERDEMNNRECHRIYGEGSPLIMAKGGKGKSTSFSSPPTILSMQGGEKEVKNTLPFFSPCPVLG
ncbi:hypothetical protein M8J76_012805 [Diaphorina citri]|nr:hypothetical protein M8J76_012805 [Diaphorina citri]